MTSARRRTAHILAVLAVAAAAFIPSGTSGTVRAATEVESHAHRRLAPAALPEAPHVSAAVEGTRLESKSTFTLDADAATVRVVYEATITNQTGGSSFCDAFRCYSSYSYIPELGVPIVGEAVDVTATKDDGSPLTTRVDGLDNPAVSLAVVDLVPDLRYQDSASIRLTYDIPPVAPRTDGISRVNGAFASFPVFAWGDPGVTGVEVAIPEAYEVEVIGGFLTELKRDGHNVYYEDAIEDPETFEVAVVARNDDELTSRRVELGEGDALLLGWPDDDEWLDFVGDHLERGVPAMADLLGLPWPIEHGLEVVETVSPYIHGYAGWFVPDDELIEIGDELDAHVILHELSHAWFNRDVYTTRWVTEALADVYSARTQEALGNTRPAPHPTSPTDGTALPLNEWSLPVRQLDLSFDEEAYGYDTSWGLLDRIVDEIGLERVSEIVRLSHEQTVTYGAPDVRSTSGRTHSWKQFLDLVIDVGGSTTAEQLFRDLVVTPDEVALLDARTEARQAYDSLVVDSNGWHPPLPVRAAMSDWDYEGADRHIGAVRELLPARDAVLADLEDLGIEPPEAFRQRWETAGRLGDLSRDLRRAETAIEAYRTATSQRDDTDGPLAFVGLALGDVDDELDEVHRQLANGAFEEAAATAADVQDTLDEATESGVARLLALAALLGTVVALRRSGLRPPPDWVSRLGPHTITSPPTH